MKPQNVLIIFKAVLVTLLGATLMSCQKDGRSLGPALSNISGNGSGNGSGGGAGSGNSPGPQVCEGTCDGGGGNGVNGKLYESYIKDPTSLLAYKEHVAPIIDHVDREHVQAIIEWADPKERDSVKSDVGQMKIFRELFKAKKWFIAPVSLATLDKKRIGLVFSRSNTEQLAFQTENEVWIDAEKFSKMSSLDQADLILHEYVMSLYLLKTKSFRELCLLGSKASGKSDVISTCVGSSELPNAVERAQRSAQLEEQDYVRIRNLTDFLKRDALQSSGRKIGVEFVRNGFDLRLFDVLVRDPLDGGSAESKQTELTNIDVLKLLEARQFQNEAPDTCFAITLNKKAKCQFETKAIADARGAKHVEIKYIYAGVVRPTPYHLASSSSISRHYDPIREKYYYSLQLPTPLSQLYGERKSGSKSTSVVLYFRKRSGYEEKKFATPDELEFVGALEKPNVLVDVAGKTYREQITPKPVDFEDDTLLFTSEEHLPSLQLFGLEFLGYDGRISQ